MPCTQRTFTASTGGLRALLAGMAAVAVVLAGVPASTAAEYRLASACADAPQGRFADVSGVHEAGIDCIGWWGVTQGTGDGSYGPGSPVNRAQMATFVARAIELSGGALPEAPPTAFDDTADSVHAAAIDALAALAVVGGVGDGLYAPDREVTRGQMATFLAGAWEARTGDKLAAGEVVFDDIEGNVHAQAIAAITGAGWTGGTGPGIYEPGQAVTRAQMGTFLARWLTTLVEEGHATYPPANPVPIPVRDGEQWQRIPHDDAVFGGDRLQIMRSVTTGGPGLVAAGVDFGRDAAAVWTSTDGTDWQRVVHDEQVFGGPDEQQISSVTAGGPGLVAVGSAGSFEESSAAVWTSTDGTNWQRVAHDEQVFGGSGPQLMYSVTAGGPGLVAVGEDWGRDVAAVWTSTDGLSWQRVEHDQTAFGGEDRVYMGSVTAGGPGLVAVGAETGQGGAVWTSTDGVTWRRVADQAALSSDGSPLLLRSVTAGGPGLVAVGYQGDRPSPRSYTAAVWTSTDGLSWQRVAHNEAVFGELGAQGGLFMESVTAAGSELIAVGYEWKPAEDEARFAAVWTTSDGVSWHRVEHDEAVFGGGNLGPTMESVTVGGPGLVAVGVDNGQGAAAVWTSP